MRVLVTGANGFIGSHLVSALVSAGHEVRGLVRRTSNLRWLEGAAIQLVYGDVADEFTLPAAVEGVDAVCHLASTTRVVSADACDRVNCGGTRNLLVACRSARRPPERFILLSSQAAAGPSPDPVSEADPPRPVSYYGMSKLHAEEVALAAREERRVVILRPPAVFGPRDTDSLEFFRLLNRGWRLQIGLKPRRTSVCYVADLVAAIVRCLVADVQSGAVYSIADPQPRTWNEFFSAAAVLIGRPARALVLPPALFRGIAWVSERIRPSSALTLDKARELTAGDWVCATDRAERELGFRTRYRLDDALAETVAWYRSAGWL